MDPSSFFLLLLEGIIVMGEGMVWMLFRRNMMPVSFPHESDTSSLRFFTFTRLRLLAILHTIFLLAIVAIIFLLPW